MSREATLFATATDDGIVEWHKDAPATAKQLPIADWHDELQSYLHERSIVRTAGMTRATATSYCG